MAYAGGWEGDVKIGTDTSTMRAASPINLQNIDSEFKNQLEEIYKMGSRSPQAIKEGLIQIAGKIAKYYENNTLPGYAVQTGALTQYTIGVYPFGYDTGEPGFILVGYFDGCKFSGGVGKVSDIEMPFKCISWTADTVP